jgi:hypothetical protein
MLGMIEPPVPWPWPGDTELDKTRRVFHDYRREFRRIAPDVVARLDAAARRLGQYWVAPTRADLDLEATLPAADMARHLGGDLTADRIRQWGARGHVPRRTDRDGRTVYRIGDILDHLADQRRARADRATRQPTS